MEKQVLCKELEICNSINILNIFINLLYIFTLKVTEKSFE